MITLKYIHCPNCQRINGAVSVDSTGVQEIICKDSRCRTKFYVVNAKIEKEFKAEISFV